MNETAHTISRIIMCILGIGLIILDIYFFEKNAIIASIGGLIILASGIRLWCIKG